MTDKDTIDDDLVEVKSHHEDDDKKPASSDAHNLHYLLILLMSAGNTVLAITLLNTGLLTYRQVMTLAIILEILIIVLVFPRKSKKNK